jgi:hypothetical protein
VGVVTDLIGLAECATALSPAQPEKALNQALCPLRINYLIM